MGSRGTKKAISFLIMCGLWMALARADAKSVDKSISHLTLGQLTVGNQLPPFNAFVSYNDPNWSLKRMLRKNLESKTHDRFVLSFFRTDCPPCLTGLKTLKDHHSVLAHQGIHIVLINYNERPRTVDTWLEHNGLKGVFFVGYDKYGYSGTEYGITTSSGGQAPSANLPLTVILNGHGVVQRIITAEGTDYIDLIKSPFSFRDPP